MVDVPLIANIHCLLLCACTFLIVPLCNADFLEDDFGDDMGYASGSKMPTESVDAPNLHHVPKEEHITEEEFDKMLEERYKPSSSFVTYAEDAYESKRSMETSTNLPSSTKDPVIWKVKCMVMINAIFIIMFKSGMLCIVTFKIGLVADFLLEKFTGWT